MSTVSTSRTLTRRPSLVEDAPEPPTARFREAIASRCPEHHSDYPRSTELEARCLSAVAPILHGFKAELRGIRSAHGFRSMLAGERHLHLSDVCRMATTPCPDARAGALALLTELAMAIGYRLEAMPGTAADAHAAVASFVRADADFSAHAVEALSDGVLEPHEIASLRTKLEATKKTVATLDGVLAAASR